MKKIISILLFVLTYTLLYVTPTEAHVLAVDKSIGAVLHIDPEDDPIAGVQSSFFFEFKDKDNKFASQDCTCTFSIRENGKEIYTQPLFQNSQNPSLTNASVFYTFPQRDVYEVQVDGKPNTLHTFQPFTLTYDIRVERTADQSIPAQTPNWFQIHFLHVIGGAVIFLSFFVLAIINKVKEKSHKKGGEKKNE